MTSKYSHAHSMVGFNPEGRPENDFYPTPPRGTQALMEHEKFTGNIWECACGNGRMSKVIEMYNYEVISTDLEPREYGTQLNFLTAVELLAPNIVTNPPFRYGQQFMEKALSLGCEKLCLLNKIQFLEGTKRADAIIKTHLTKVLVFKKRLTIMREGREQKGGGMMTYAWFVWEKGYTGKPFVEWL